MMRKIILL